MTSLRLRHASHGFTLLELVVVLGVFGLVSVMAYGGLNNVLRAREGIESNLERAATLQRAYLRMREDFQQIQPRIVRDGFGDDESAVLGLREDRLSFTRSGWQNPANRQRSQMQRVSWERDGGRLVRSVYRVLDRAPTTQAESADILTGVDRVQFRYLDNRREWQEEWPPGITQQATPQASAIPPLAIELTLETDDWGTLVFLFPTGSQASLPGGSGPGPGPGGGPGTGAGPYF